MADISNVSGVGSNLGKSAQSATSFGGDFDSFLILLTQQLKNQDPLKPMDATEFTTQLVQFTGVEQQIRQNQNLEDLITLQHSSLVSSMTQYLGNTVDTVGNSVLLTESGPASITYSLPSQAKSVTLEILNSGGETIRTVQVDNAKGSHTYEWDGKNSGGAPVPAGNYSLKFTAVDGVNSPIDVGTSSSGKVTEVEIQNGLIILTVGGNKIPLSEVKSVRQTPITTT
jgi:flagellar basal-body rod modification protein FlgD